MEGPTRRQPLPTLMEKGWRKQTFSASPFCIRRCFVPPFLLRGSLLG